MGVFRVNIGRCFNKNPSLLERSETDAVQLYCWHKPSAIEGGVMPVILSLASLRRATMKTIEWTSAEEVRCWLHVICVTAAADVHSVPACLPGPIGGCRCTAF